MQKSSYQCVDNKIIIDCFYDREFNNQSLEIISKYDKLIFSDYHIGINKKSKFKKLWEKNFDDNGKYKGVSGEMEQYDNIFNQKINNLPNISSLIMSENFNQKINNLSQINYLHLKYYFNKPIEYLPNSLNILNIYDCAFNKKCNNLHTV